MDIAAQHLARSAHLCDQVQPIIAEPRAAHLIQAQQRSLDQLHPLELDASMFSTV